MFTEELLRLRMREGDKTQLVSDKNWIGTENRVLINLTMPSSSIFINNETLFTSISSPFSRIKNLKLVGVSNWTEACKASQVTEL